MIPLPLFPDWALVILEHLPFRGMMDIPSRIYTGLIPLSSIPSALLFQLIWIIVIVLIGKLLLKKALKNLIIQGG
jgi:ABC-2 type transport system permease protein